MLKTKRDLRIVRRGDREEECAAVDLYLHLHLHGVKKNCSIAPRQGRQNAASMIPINAHSPNKLCSLA